MRKLASNSYACRDKKDVIERVKIYLFSVWPFNHGSCVEVAVRLVCPILEEALCEARLLLYNKNYIIVPVVAPV